jgi:hypothetical protein
MPCIVGEGERRCRAALPDGGDSIRQHSLHGQVLVITLHNFLSVAVFVSRFRFGWLALSRAIPRFLVRP